MKNWLDKYSEEIPQAQKGKSIPATRQDSLAVRNSSLNFKKISKNLGYTPVYNMDIYTEDNQNLYNFKNDKISINKNIDDASEFRENTNTRKNGDIYLNSNVNRKGGNKNKNESIGYGHPVLKKENAHQYSTTEQASFLGYNTDLPTILMDARIKPQRRIAYSLNNKNKDTDYAVFNEYDPIAVTPFDMLSDKEKVTRVKQYGRDGVPDSYQPSIIKKANTSTGKQVKKQGNKGMVYDETIKHPIQFLKTNLQAKGLVKSDFALDANVNIRNKARIPKYYNIEDNSNPNAGMGSGYGGNQSNYRSFNPSVLPHSDNRKITPVYQNGQDIINASKDVPAIEGSQFDTKRIVNYQPGVMSGNEPGFYLYSKLQTDRDFNVDRDREFIKQNEMLTVQRTPQWVEYMKGKAKTKPAQALASYQDGGVIDDDMGQWAHPGKITRINSNNITMQGVDYPVLGVSDTGDTQMMYPGENYQYEGSNVTEYPQVAQDGSFIQKKDSLDNKNILNFKKPYVEKEIKSLQNQAKNSKVVVFAEAPTDSTYKMYDDAVQKIPQLSKITKEFYNVNKEADKIYYDETYQKLINKEEEVYDKLNELQSKYKDSNHPEIQKYHNEWVKLKKLKEKETINRDQKLKVYTQKLDKLKKAFDTNPFNPIKTDSSFIKEGQNVKDFYKRTNPNVNVDVVPMYENPKLMQQKLKGLTQFDKAAIFGHMGSKLAGIQNDSIAKYLNDSKVKDCYLGTCHGQQLVEGDMYKKNGLSKIKNKTLNYRPAEEFWYGFNPDAKTFDEGMWSRNSVMGKTDYQYKEQITPIKEGKTHIVKKVQNGGKIITAQNGLRQEQKSLQNLDNLINFTNYNTPQPGGWLDKY